MIISGTIKHKKNRYELWRIWNNQKPLILFILLNPSTADDKNDDKTVKKLIGFTKKYDFGGFYIGNLFSYISSSPNPKKFVHNEIKNINHIKKMKKKCKKVVVGWGNLGNNPIWLSDIGIKPMCFGLNKNGTPKHPLYLSFKTELIKYPVKL